MPYTPSWNVGDITSIKFHDLPHVRVIHLVHATDRQEVAHKALHDLIRVATNGITGVSKVQLCENGVSTDIYLQDGADVKEVAAALIKQLKQDGTISKTLADETLIELGVEKRKGAIARFLDRKAEKRLNSL